ncbi:hypothetical protein [Kitasatospora mediocidica]|uniref:hypothetical protein n=1 Tax=Kitasatospora mediocidica TaxID=58352 RepID=UPI00056D688D|nr:hypothetical protein [Kitasatospora mediocidica]
MKPDEVLRALAALEAAWKRDDVALAALAQRGPDEAALPVLVADYGDMTLQALLTLAFRADGLTDPDELEERLRVDVTARVCTSIGRTLTSWAATAPDESAGDIARAVLDAIVNFTEGADEDKVIPLLTALRATALLKTD